MNVANRKKIIRKICIIMLFLTIVIVVLISIFGIWLDRKPQGFSMVTEEGIAEFYYFGGIVNVTPYTREVFLEASSERDIGGFLAVPELEITEIRAYTVPSKLSEEGIKYEGNKIVIPPFTELRLEIICKGQYGGEGNGDRHPPEISISWPETLHIR